MEAKIAHGASTACPYAGRQFTNVGLEQLRRALCSFATERAWTEHHTPRNLLLSLVKEVCDSRTLPASACAASLRQSNVQMAVLLI
jgi:hypothetical protein